MEIKEIKEKSIWEEFLSQIKEKTFLCSWNWGEFNERMGNKIWRWGVFNQGELKALALISEIKAKRGTFLLMQHSPVVAEEESKHCVLEALLKELRRIGKVGGAIAVRMNPLWDDNEENRKILKGLGFKESPMHANSYDATWKLDISFPEEELMGNMRKTTRYLIKQAMKNSDISIEKSADPKSIELYQKMNKEVSRRQKFTPFSDKYIQNEFEVFCNDGSILFLFGKYKENLAAASLIIFWSGIAFYHQAASLPKFSRLSIPYLLQWEAIREAKRRGCALYDFWGYVDPQKNPNHPWSGPTLFKMGFGGNKFEYVKTKDYPLSLRYYPTYLFEKLRKARRGL
ncbi:MAG: peptidoglycan bridge formation glycyltransferase FemA/FemB family protein [Candidatus Pacebacteria bacterium]|nr:peptidoglycan bridge formation glycyltransferase FemA/FemB family protein [Candidatus Paceibacterota bacterium]